MHRFRARLCLRACGRGRARVCATTPGACRKWPGSVRGMAGKWPGKGVKAKPICMRGLALA
eukprot:4941910-Lingulodinium_polyedra.AAC.1